MKCPKCNFDNPSDSGFCSKCGTQLLPSEEISAPTETLEAAKEELTTGSTFAGRYQIIEELGKGGMGKVYRVLDKKLKEEVALKLIKPEIASDKKTVERFSNELKIARKIVHKNVARMFDLNEEKETHYITMEYVRGEDLKRLIRKVGQLSARQVIPIAMQICEGLIEAHRLEVVHRDLKPQNIMIDEEGNARIMDFGIARSVTGKGVTGPGIMIGTPEYMSPEQVEGKVVDQRSDIYSLGVILYEMMTGRVPFEGETSLSIAYKHKHDIPQDPRKHNSQIPEDLSRLVLKCLEKNPNKRYNNPQNLIYELQKILKELLHKGDEVSIVSESSTTERRQRANKHLQKPRHVTLDKELAKIIAYSQLLIKNDIIHVTFNRSERIVTAINEITKKILWDSDEIFFINQGGGEITCIFDREKEALFQNVLPKAREIREKTAIIRIKEPKGKGFTSGIEIPGLYAFFINRLSDIGINILDIISTGSQLTLVLEEEDLVRAYSALSESVKDFRKRV